VVDTFRGGDAMIPNTLAQGASYSISIELTDYPSADWVVQVWGRNKSNGWTIAESTVDGVRAFVMSAAWTSESLLPGRYNYTIRATNKDTDAVAVIQSGVVDVMPDITASATFDGRTHAEKCLESIEAVLECRATTDQQMYMINGRQLQRMQIKDLIFLRDRYRVEVARERAKAQGRQTLGRRIQVRL
jgi:hypothetical protein